MTTRTAFAALAMSMLAAAGAQAGAFADCNENGIDDAIDLVEGTSIDCNANDLPDECDVLPPGTCGEYEPPMLGGGGGATGCDVPACLDAGCAVDPFCCATAWDDVCGREALRLCGRSTDCNLNGIPDECDCSGDLDGDGNVGFVDLNELLRNWGAVALPDPPVTGDLDCSGSVGFTDLNAVLDHWGQCPVI